MLAEKLFEKIGFADEAILNFEKYNKLIGEKSEQVADDYMNDKIDIFDAEKILSGFETEEVSKYTYHLLFCFHATGALLENYKKEGLPEELFYETMKDLKYKLTECKKVSNVYGMRSILWYDGFFKKYRHAFGRLQFDRMQYEGERIERAGCVLFEGDFVLNCHIPSSGPLKHELCIESYKMAYEFFKDKTIDGILPILCSSWLLYPEYIDVFTRESNICKFAADYRIFDITTKEKFDECWRVFDRVWEDINKCPLPQDTSLQRSFVKYMNEGGSFGLGKGIIFFDGERVLTKNQYLL